MVTTDSELHFLMHELLAPLRQARQWSELLNDDISEETSDTTKEVLKHLLNSTSLAEEMVAAVGKIGELLIARPTIEVISIDQLLQEQAQLNGLTLAALATVDFGVDKALLSTALGHIFGNVVSHNTQATVAAEALVEQGALIIKISNPLLETSGPAPKHALTVPFVKGVGRASPNNLGIGLTMAKAALTYCNGTVTAQAGPEDRFVVTLTHPAVN